MPLWLHWIVLGLVAGALAKFLMPGRDPAGCLITVALGIVGALLGGWIGSHLGWGAVSATGFSIRSIALATLGAIVLLLLGRLVASLRRRSTGRE
jgi:uncharacterized membrane protein YeaQ/YmgE (transglycosylase-associated protein family)